MVPRRRSLSIQDNAYDHWVPQAPLFEPNEILDGLAIRRIPPRLCDNCRTQPAYRTETRTKERTKGNYNAPRQQLRSLCQACYRNKTGLA